MSSLNQNLASKKKLIDKALDEYLPVVFPEELYRAARHLIKAGGKRLRPTVLLLGAQTVQPDIAVDAILPAAVAVELVHNFTLIHDDIMDADATRRSIETVHTKWGTSEGILAGDALYAKAFEVLSYTKTQPDAAMKCLRLLSKACLHICEGQWLDITFEHNKNVSEADYLDMVQKKTAVLYAAGLAMGGILGGASDNEVNALWEFGIALGISFQIRDDVLDLITPSEVLGKDRASDLIEGKMTLVMIHGLRHRVIIEPSRLADENGINNAVEALQRSGSINYAMEKARELLEVGKSRLSLFANSEAKKELMKLADFAVSREY
ncbi:MAG TPA: polyprenyl synthetase family protein [Candidatus Acidoferrales bacterium]|nr:polyprenyl synthetase family protein [Candidatus Acidoferrales bacterium]